jgi:hypothetical protein
MLQQPRRKTGTIETAVYTKNHMVMVKMLAQNKMSQRVKIKCNTQNRYTICKHMNRVLNFCFRQVVGTVCKPWMNFSSIIEQMFNINLKVGLDDIINNMREFRTTVRTCIHKMEGFGSLRHL